MSNAEIIFEGCLASSSNSNDPIRVMECVAKGISADSRQFSRDFLLVLSAALVFFMQAGFASLCAGSVRIKNVENTMLKNLLDACGSALSFFAVGYALAFGGQDDTSSSMTFVGYKNFFLRDVDDFGFWLFQYAFSAAAATIVAGALAERCQMIAYLAYSIVLTGWVYPVVAHAVWSPQGFLSAARVDPLLGVGMVDFAGSGVVHLTGGMTALLAVIILGPRFGRYHDTKGKKLDTPQEIEGHSVALQMLGTFILWLGWYGFNAGSALLLESDDSAKLAALAGVNNTLSAGAGGVVALFVHLILEERRTGEVKYNVKYAMNGSLSGLVAITGGCGVVEPWAAVVIGVVAGLLYMLGSWAMVKYRLDDAVDAVPVHMANGIWGLVSVGLFASSKRLESAYPHIPPEHAGWFYDLSDGRLLGAQLAGIVFILGWVLGSMMPFFVFLDWYGLFRVRYSEEILSGQEDNKV